jgi:hypothetical protein
LLLPVCPRCGCVPAVVPAGGRCPACGGKLAAGALAGVPPEPGDDDSGRPPWRRERIGTMIGSLAGVGVGFLAGLAGGAQAAPEAAHFAIAVGLVAGLLIGGLVGTLAARLTAPR